MIHQKVLTFFIVVLGTIVLCVSIGFAFPRGLYVLPMVLALIPLVILFLNKPKLIFILMIMTFFSGLRLPFLAASFNLFHLLAVFYIFIGFLDLFVRKERAGPQGLYSFFLVMFLANIFLLIAVRGAGLRFLGDENWGGMRYVLLILSCCIFLNANFVSLTEKQWKIALFFSFLLGLLPFFAELIFIFSGGKITFHYHFIEFASSTIHNLGTTLLGGEGVGRLQTARQGGEMLILIALGFVFVHNKKRVFTTLIVVLLGLALIGLSGHRLGLIRAVAIIWVFLAIQNRHQIWKYIILSSLCLVSGVLLMYLVAPLLPLTAQRMISFLPGVQIDIIAESSAHNTTEWRINLWRYALTEIPDYLFVGKGLTFPAHIREDLILAGHTEYVKFWAVETVAYHNGILSLLIAMGLSGLIFGTCFLILVAVRYTKAMFSTWEDLRLKNLYAVLFSLFIVDLGVYYTLYGDVQQSFPLLLFNSAMLEGLMWRNRLMLDGGSLAVNVAIEKGFK
ncbi:O-antigen ligase family protein [Kiritimatiellota bacterium B12222]|nr:O-antigen ligase family protein [Kiritimatiellota bacterium B12222]